MEKPKKYEILGSLPTYGPLPISVTENNESYFSEGLPVRFFKSDNTNWVAYFKPGWTGYNDVFEFENQSNLIVIAGGTLYIMNPENEKPIKVFGVGFERSFKNNFGQIVLQNQVDLTIIEKDGSYWTTERISYDGIKNLKVDDNIVRGFSFTPTSADDEWNKFILDLNTREIKGGSFEKVGLVKRFKQFWKL
jgi:hypothetical protein